MKVGEKQLRTAHNFFYLPSSFGSFGSEIAKSNIRLISLVLIFGWFFWYVFVRHKYFFLKRRQNNVKICVIFKIKCIQKLCLIRFKCDKIFIDYQKLENVTTTLFSYGSRYVFGFLIACNFLTTFEKSNRAPFCQNIQNYHFENCYQFMETNYQEKL